MIIKTYNEGLAEVAHALTAAGYEVALTPWTTNALGEATMALHIEPWRWAELAPEVRFGDPEPYTKGADGQWLYEACIRLCGPMGADGWGLTWDVNTPEELCAKVASLQREYLLAPEPQL